MSTKKHLLKLLAFLLAVVSCGETSFRGDSRQVGERVLNDKKTAVKDMGLPESVATSVRNATKVANKDIEPIGVHRDKVKKEESPFTSESKFLLSMEEPKSEPVSSAQDSAAQAAAKPIETMKAGTPITVVYKVECLKKRSPSSAWLLSYVNPDLVKITETIGGEAASRFELRADLTTKDMDYELKNDACIVGASIDKGKTITAAAEPSANSVPLAKFGYTASEQTDCKIDGSKVTSIPRVKVAVIDSGIDLSNKKFADSLSKDLGATNVIEDSAVPNDDSGHGTAMASIIAASDIGLAAEEAEIIPIRMTRNATKNEASAQAMVTSELLYKSIATAVNKGAEVISISLSGEGFGCDPIVGQAIYKALEKGSFFSISAGNGLIYAPEIKIGYPVTAARDDGPLNFQRTKLPACWGRYFRGAVAVTAASNVGGQASLPNFASYSDDIELAAPGVDVQSYGLNSAKQGFTGSSISAAYVAAAAAKAIYHHKARGFAYDPWYIEDLIVNSAAKKPELASRERRTRFGSVVDLGALNSLLKKTECMSAEERRAIPTVNPRIGDGFIPGRDSNLARLEISADKAKFSPGDKAKFSAILFYKQNKKEIPVSDSKEIIWASSFESQELLDFYPQGSSDLLKIDSVGNLTLGSDEVFKNFIAKYNAKYDKSPISSVKFVIVANYSEEQSQVYNTFNLVVQPGKPAEPKVVSLTIKPPLTEVRVGDQNNSYQLLASLDNSQTLDVTDLATWSSNNSLEFRPTLVPGTFSSENSGFGSAYTISANYQGVSASYNVTVLDEKILNFLATSVLGDNGVIEQGQEMTVEGILTLETRRFPVKAQWLLDGKSIGSDLSQVKFGTKDLSYGNHAIAAKASVKVKNATREFNSSLNFVVGSDIERIQISLKEAIAQAGSNIAIDVRAYKLNNSYEVITDKVKFTVSDPTLITLDSSGRAYLKPESAEKTIVVSTEYKDKKASIGIAVIKASNVTGSSSKLADLNIQTSAVNGHFCVKPKVTKVEAVYEDGSRRDVTSVATLSYELQSPSGVVGDFANPTSYYGGGRVQVSAYYNDGSIASGGGGEKSKTISVNIPSLASVEVPKLHFESYEKNGSTITNYFDRGCSKITSLQFTPTIAFGGDPDSLFSLDDKVAPGSYNYKVTYENSATGEKKTYTANGVMNVMGPVVYRIADQYANNNVNYYTRVDTEEGGQKVRSYQAKSGLVMARESCTHESGGVCAVTWDLKTSVYLSLLLKSDLPFNVAGPTSDYSWNLKYGSQVISGVQAVNIGSGITLNQCSARDQVPDSFALQYEGAHTPTKSITRTVLNVKKVKPLASIDITPDAIAVRSIAANSKVSSFCTAERSAKAPFASGTGEEQDPYVICTAAQLKNIAAVTEVRYHFKLENNIDFGGAQIQSIKPANSGYRGIVLEGNGFEVRNFKIIDSERDNIGLFTECGDIRNLGVRNPYIRGRDNVGAVCGLAFRLNNVYTTGGTVWGRNSVGGLAGKMFDTSYTRSEGKTPISADLSNDRTLVQFEGMNAGGIIGTASRVTGYNFALIDASNNADVTHIGVPGSGGRVGGILGYMEYQGSIVRSVNSGNVTASGNSIGGILGEMPYGAVLNSVSSGNIVGSGVYVGGVLGKVSALNNSSLPVAYMQVAKPLDASKVFKVINHYPQQGDTGGVQLVVNSKSSGNIWGGMSLKFLKCQEGLIEVLGQYGSITCDGNVVSSVGGVSATGGLVGGGSVNIYNSEASGNVRSVNQSGGIIGLATRAILSANRFTGTASVSDTTGDVGKLAGRVELKICGQDTLLAPYKSLMLPIGNSWTNNQQQVNWAFGSVDNVKNVSP